MQNLTFARRTRPAVKTNQLCKIARPVFAVLVPNLRAGAKSEHIAAVLGCTPELPGDTERTVVAATERHVPVIPGGCGQFLIPVHSEFEGVLFPVSGSSERPQQQGFVVILPVHDCPAGEVGIILGVGDARGQHAVLPTPVRNIDHGVSFPSEYPGRVGAHKPAHAQALVVFVGASAVHLPNNHGLAEADNGTHLIVRHGTVPGTAHGFKVGHAERIHVVGSRQLTDSFKAVVGVEVAPGLAARGFRLGQIL